eukprot:TRINITY_DN27885_c0_g1_i1.p1 TRINITY_DN27885_c0_g1~~TRINITY_DN27885_c0_g1_i1.p1  ORF type:complete len:494 (+),score=130.75 TRINITY_DN27885_c0_g1_i1:43-1524(+)
MKRWPRSQVGLAGVGSVAAAVSRWASGEAATDVPARYKSPTLREGGEVAGENIDAPASFTAPTLRQQSDEEKSKVWVNQERPASIQEAGDGPLPLDFKPGAGTDIIDHHMDLAERHYKPNTVASLDELLEHEKKREHLHIYRANPERAVQTWEGGQPRFIRAPMHKLLAPTESRNAEVPLGPVLHDTRTGVAVRVLGQMIPSPEMVVREDMVRSAISLGAARFTIWGWLFVLAFLYKFVTYMALRTKLRIQGIANPVLPANRVKLLEILWFAREDFKQYKLLYNQFTTEHWLPYRQLKLREESKLGEAAAKELNEQLETKLQEKKSLWAKMTGWFSRGGDSTATKESTIIDLHVPELNGTFKVDTSKTVIGFSKDGPVYAPPDVQILTPEELQRKMSTLNQKIASQMDKDCKDWAEKDFDKRSRDVANDFVVRFHVFLNDKGVLKPLDAHTVDNMYELQSVPRIQDINNLTPENPDSGASSGLATRPQLVRVK